MITETKEKEYIHWGWAIMAFVLLIYIFSLVLLVIMNPMINLLYICLPVTFVLLLILAFVYKIAITIDETYFTFRLGIGIVKKRYKIESIKSCKPYLGFSKRIGIGCKMSLGGKVLKYYILTGFNAIELRFHDKQHLTVLVGTNKADEICQYIQDLLENKITDASLGSSPKK